MQILECRPVAKFSSYTFRGHLGVQCFFQGGNNYMYLSIKKCQFQQCSTYYFILLVGRSGFTIHGVMPLRQWHLELGKNYSTDFSQHGACEIFFFFINSLLKSQRLLNSDRHSLENVQCSNNTHFPLKCYILSIRKG